MKKSKAKVRHEKLLKKFVAYCKAHPQERFWQALRNWSGVPFIFQGDGATVVDTFYFEKKNT